MRGARAVNLKNAKFHLHFVFSSGFRAKLIRENKFTNGSLAAQWFGREHRTAGSIFQIVKNENGTLARKVSSAH